MLNIPSNIPPAGEDDIITQPFEHTNGIMQGQESPGLGVELDEKKLAKYSLPINL